VPPIHTAVAELELAHGHPDHDHVHTWTNESGQLLACADCDVPWPGEPLPSPDNWCEPEWRRA
jgi:hypothetical protein